MRLILPLAPHNKGGPRGFRAVKHYDAYGFEIEGWADDAKIQAAGFQSKSEQLVATMHEVLY